MDEKKTIGEQVDDIVSKMSEKVAKAKDKIAVAKGNIGGIASDISAGVKKVIKEAKE